MSQVFPEAEAIEKDELGNAVEHPTTTTSLPAAFDGDPQAEVAKELEFDDSSYADEPADEPAAAQSPTEHAAAGSEPTPATEQAEEEQPEPLFPDDLLRDAGLTAEQAQAQFGSKEALANAVRLLDSRFVQAGQRQLAPTLPQPPAAAPQDAWSVPAAAQQPVAQPPVAELELPKPSEGEDWDDDTKRLVAAITAQQKAELARRDQALMEQQQMLQALVQEQRFRAQRQYINEFDGFVNSLGDEWTSVLGKGSGFDLAPGSLHLQGRDHLDRVAREMAAGRAAYGQPELPKQELLSRALRVAFPEQHATAIKQQVTQQVVQRQQMMTQRPTQRRSKPLTGLEKASQTAEEWYKKHGMATDGDDFDTNDF